MATTLNTANPEYLLWEYQQVWVTILGGIRIEGLDRMSVTLKLSWKEQVIRHNLDLYNDAAADKLVKRRAERFALGTGFMAELVTALTNTLEQYSLELKKGQSEQIRNPMTSDRRNEIIPFLKQPDLLTKTNELIGRSGVIGEGINRLLMYIVFTSRKGEQPLHIISLGSSGTGKSHLQEKV